ncbi:MAG: carbohydrate-binding family 9-like protein [Burkholderiales bacterium]
MSRVALAVIGLAATAATSLMPRQDFEALPFNPRRTVCYRASAPIDVDGKLDDAPWRAVAWSELFVDIDGRRKPSLATRVKMLWDDQYFYIAAELEEPDVWATLTARDSVIFQDNDFEAFIDPDGDTHAYYELEVNALNTVWDLMLVQPYRDGGPALHAWDIAGLRSAVHVRGTINRPGDRDQGWTVELALPWTILGEAAPGRRAPRDRETWRVNFSRVQWQTDAVDGKYVKRTNTATGKPLPEDNWVWSAQGAINMHMPERWGFVQFSTVSAGTREVPFVEDRNEGVKWALRRLYYRQRQFRDAHGRYATDAAALAASDIRVEALDFVPSMQATDSSYEIAAPGFDGAVVRIRQDGKVWTTKPGAEPATRRSAARWPPGGKQAAREDK